MKKGLLFGFCMFTVFGFSQKLQVEDIMKGNDFIGHQPENHVFAADENSFVFEWNPKKEAGSSTYFATINDSKTKKLTGRFSILDIPFQQDQLRFETIYVLNQGVLYSYSKSTKKLKKIVQLQDKIQAVYRSLTPEIIFLSYQKNIFQLNTNDFSMVQITNFIKQKEPKEAASKSPFFRQTTNGII